MIVLAIDPGLRSGGLAVVDTDARRVLFGYEWWPMAKRKADAGKTIERRWMEWRDGRYLTFTERQPVEIYDSRGAFTWIPFDAHLIDAVVVEGVPGYTARGPGGAIAAAEGAGAWVQWVRSTLHLDPLRVEPAVWRRAVLGALPGRLSSKQLDERVELWATAVLKSPLVTAGGHDAEAMAWWAGRARWVT